MLRLLLDQGLPRRCAGDLTELGWDAVHVGALGLATAADEDILRLARSDARVVVTLDSDFSRILARLRFDRPSVVHVRIERLDRTAMTGLLAQVLPELEEDLERGVVASVTPRGTRLRDLPITP